MSIKSICAILWALIGMGAWTFTEWQASNQGTLVEFEVGGYDPRDLLSGHYVIYRVNYGSDTICASTPETEYIYPNDRCLCLAVDPATGRAKTSSVEQCNSGTTPSCALWLKGNCDYSGQFQANIERFYIPEAYSQFLMTVPENTTILVNVTARGRGLVKELRIAGKSLEEFIAGKRARL